MSLACSKSPGPTSGRGSPRRASTLRMPAARIWAHFSARAARVSPWQVRWATVGMPWSRWIMEATSTVGPALPEPPAE